MEKLWFRRKRFGWGWIPASKEGWLVTVLFILIVFYITRYVGTDPVLFWGYLVLSIAALIIIAYKTGEKPRWQWGKNK